MKTIGSLLFLFACTVASIPAQAEYLDLSKGEITNVMDCEMNNGVKYTCLIVKFEKNNYVLALDQGKEVGEWKLKDEVTTLLWKKEGISFDE